MKNILIVVGTRPNFIKVTQFKKLSLGFSGLELKIAHTGQHSDRNMAEVFFEQFNLMPDYYLNIDGITPLQQMSQILIRLEHLIQTEFKPDLIITPGDVNSTLAVSIVANKLNIKLAHLESGLRSFDRGMPEEINRILTDEVSDYYFVTEKSGIKHLQDENKKGQIHFVGNTMIDTLVAFEPEIDQSPILETLKIYGEFVLITMHRPATVDFESGLIKLLDLLSVITKKYHVIFPIHPRTLKRLDEFNLIGKFQSLKNLVLTNSLGYFEFQKLVKNANFVITDSGGVQEETTFRKVPCLTLRPSTERPVTVEEGSNTLIDFDVPKILNIIEEIEQKKYKTGQIPEMWDGLSTERILKICIEVLNR